MNSTVSQQTRPALENPVSPCSILLLITWIDDGDWYLLNRLRELGYRVDVLEPSFLRSSWAPAGLKRLSKRLGSFYQPILALMRGRHYGAMVTWDTRMGTMLGLLSRLIPRKFKAPHILRDFHLDLTRMADPLYMLRVLMVRLAVPGIDMFLTTSGQETDLYATMFTISERSIMFFPDCPGGSFLNPPPYTEAGYVFAYGNSDRDFDTLMAAARDISSPVVILSQNWQPSGPLPANVRVISHRIPQEELIEYIAKAQVVVIPIKSYFVAAGQNAMLEVMSLARPLVVTSNMTTLEHARDSHDVLFHVPGDTKGLAQAVNRLLNDSQLAENLGENARKTALAFFERQVEIFQNVLGRLHDQQENRIS